ncbi:MAG: hypothetical protein E7013_02500 [Alphaproteobacteria bacterium]|nr:hypothetical protein [Alphaproteobacteria bacterium]
MGLLDLLKLTKKKKENLGLPSFISDKFDITGTPKEVEEVRYNLARIYQMTAGQELLESLSKNQKIKISLDLNDKNASGLHTEDHHVHLNKPIYLSTLYHELVHERQSQHNVNFVNALLPEDAFLSKVMCEMDALISTEYACLKHDIQNNSEDLAVYKNDNQSDIGFLYQTYLTQKAKTNSSDEEALLFAKKELAMRYFEYLPSIRQEIQNTKSNLTHSEDVVVKNLAENQNMSKSEEGHRKNIIKWFQAYQEEFQASSNLAISNHPKTDRTEMFDYYKKRLNLDCNYDDIFNRFFACKIQTQQIDEKIKNILKDGKIFASITEMDAGKEINFYYSDSDKIRYSRIEHSKSDFSIKEFDEESQLLMRDGKVKDHKFISCTEYYETGQVYSRTSYNEDGKRTYTNYYERNGMPTGRIQYDRNENFCQYEEIKDGKFIKSKPIHKQTARALLGGLLILGGVMASWLTNTKETKQTSPKTEYRETSTHSKDDISIQPPTLQINKDYGKPEDKPAILTSSSGATYKNYGKPTEHPEFLSDRVKNEAKNTKRTGKVDLSIIIQSKKTH